MQLRILEPPPSLQRALLAVQDILRLLAAAAAEAALVEGCNVPFVTESLLRFIHVTWVSMPDIVRLLPCVRRSEEDIAYNVPVVAGRTSPVIIHVQSLEYPSRIFYVWSPVAEAAIVWNVPFVTESLPWFIHMMWVSVSYTVRMMPFSRCIRRLQRTSRG